MSLTAKGKYEYWLTPEGLLLLEGWARDGLIDEQIAENMGIVPSTLYRWKNEHEEISEALKKGKEVVDRQVENALLKRALGYSYEEVTKEICENPETGNLEMKITKKVKKEVVPDTTAQIFWLKNRRPDKWRDKRDVEHSGGLNVQNQYESMTEEELMELAKKYEKINSS
ncbi:transposase [Blautia sp.]|uniref:transposase n=1 Tax=Blautia sp. TaxID=1955243 RepID=UPI00399157EE